VDVLQPLGVPEIDIFIVPAPTQVFRGFEPKTPGGQRQMVTG